eukprot:TRINITY_DN4703_c0_g1_i2.p1 TRINITY_DN4703_c0_g1~~TRINITY_DN4703_c0_g1_i2.p1  ORF type:complete len:293 (-),score=0.77 TRINITY_DN4703_c0_g1_i2:258-1136(-)
MSACCPQLDHFALRFQVDGAVPRRVGVRAIGKRQQRVLNQALKPSTALKMKANEEENDYIFSARMSTPYSQKPNTVGVLAGASVAAAAEFVKKIEHFSSVSGLQGVPLVLCSDPAVQKGLRCANLEMGKAAAVSLREKRRFLESAGACCIVMPCHVSHVWHDEICKEALVPILHIADSVACALADANLKPVERGANVKIGLLAPIHILHAGFYQKRLVDQVSGTNPLGRNERVCSQIPFFDCLFRCRAGIRGDYAGWSDNGTHRCAGDGSGEEERYGGSENSSENCVADFVC